MTYLEQLGQNAKTAARKLIKLSQQQKNDALLAIADALTDNAEEIIAANDIDMENAVNNRMSEALQDRLKLTKERIESIAEGVRQVVKLEDPIGEIISMKKRPNGLMIGQKIVPIGVIGIIYESRPNVTIDAFALTFKTSNSVILRGGSDCINSNKALVKIVRDTLKKVGITEDAISLIENTDRELVKEFVTLRDYIDAQTVTLTDEVSTTDQQNNTINDDYTNVVE